MKTSKCALLYLMIITAMLFFTPSSNNNSIAISPDFNFILVATTDTTHSKDQYIDNTSNTTEGDYQGEKIETIGDPDQLDREKSRRTLERKASYKDHLTP